MRRVASAVTFFAVILTTVLIILLVPGRFEVDAQEAPDGSDDLSRARAEIERAWAARWAAAEQVLLVAPHYRIGDGWSSELILVNRFAEAIDYTVTAVNHRGRISPLIVGTLAPRQVATLDVGSTLLPTPDGFASGSLRISYFGDAGMLQGWLLLERDGQQMVQVLSNSAASTGVAWTSFWDSRSLPALGDLEPRFAFHNVSDEILQLSLVWAGDGSVDRRVLDLLAGQSFVLADELAGLATGRLEIHHDGAPGALAAAGWLEGPGGLARLPLMTQSELVETGAFHSLALPADRRPSADADEILMVSILNDHLQTRGQQVRVEVLDLESGALLDESAVRLGAGEIRSLRVPLPPEVLLNQARRSLRLRISGDEGMIMPAAVLLRGDGSLVDVELIADSKVHDGGTYPLLDPATHEVTTTFINLGAIPAQLFGQLEWEAGTYALEPLQVPPGGGLRLDFGRLLEAAAPDSLGRLPPDGFETAFFQWLSRRGSSRLIARTEVRRRSSGDQVGFNCFGCCEESPGGVMIPEFATFEVGETAGMMAGELIYTCSGTMGPYYAYPTSMSYSSPLSWSGQQLAAGSSTSQMVSFQGEGDYMWVDCSERHRFFADDAPVAAEDACQQEHHPGFDPSEGGCCDQQGHSTAACLECCDAELAVAECRCDKLIMFRQMCKTRARQANQPVCNQPCQAGCPG